MISVNVVDTSQLDFVAAQFVVMQGGIMFTRIARLVGVLMMNDATIGLLGFFALVGFAFWCICKY